MTIYLRHNFSGYETTQDLTELDVYGNYYSFSLNLEPPAPHGEYSYRIMDGENELSSGIINYSDYYTNKYVVKDKILFVIYDN